MIETLVDWDTKLLLWLNSFHHPTLDPVVFSNLVLDPALCRAAVVCGEGLSNKLVGSGSRDHVDYSRYRSGHQFRDETLLRKTAPVP